MGGGRIQRPLSKIAKNYAKDMGLDRIMENHEKKRNNENKSEKPRFSRFSRDFTPILTRFYENSDDFKKLKNF